MKKYVVLVVVGLGIFLGCTGESKGQCPGVGLGFTSGFGQRVIVQTPRFGFGFNSGLGFSNGLGFNSGVRFVQPFNSFGLGLNFGVGGHGLGFNQAFAVNPFRQRVVVRRGLLGRRIAVQRFGF